MQKMKNLGSIGSSGRLSAEECEDEDVSKLAISAYQAKEEEIERKKMEVKERVELQLGRAEEETRRLAHIWEVSSIFRKKNMCDHILSGNAYSHVINKFSRSINMRQLRFKISFKFDLLNLKYESSNQNC